MTSKIEIKKINKSNATNFMENNEFLGNIGLGVWHWGLFQNCTLIGVISYGTPCCNYKRGWMGKLVKNYEFKLIQLCRGATDRNAPKNTASHLICKANQYMYKLLGPLLIVAYSDPEIREIGTIYQSCNAIYTGTTNPKGQGNYIINNEWLTGWQVIKLYGSRSKEILKVIDPNFKMVPLQPKHRYIFIVGNSKIKKESEKSIKNLILPYPKRDVLNIRSMKE